MASKAAEEAKEEKKQELMFQEGNQLPANFDLLADAGSGHENVSAADMAIPFLQLLEALSPQVKKKSPEYVEGAEVGGIYNTVTKEVYDGEQGVIVIPCYREKAYVEWVPRDQGGGFVAKYPFETDYTQQCTKEGNNLITPAGNHLVETAYVYVLLQSGAGVNWAVISMTKTRLRSYREWNTLINSIQLKDPKTGEFKAPATWTHGYRLTAIEKQNSAGQSFHVWKATCLGMIQSADLYDMGKSYFQAVTGGMVNITAPPEEEAEDNSEIVDVLAK